MKKILSLLLAIVMLLSITAGLTISAHAEADEPDESFTFGDSTKPTVYDNGTYKYILLEDGTAEIAGYLGLEKVNAVIPSEVDGYAVTSIGEEAFYNMPFTSVEIPNSVTNLGEGVFCECKDLTSVKLSNSLTAVSRSAFSGCVKLESIEIPESVTSIEAFAFSECSSLTEINIPDNVNFIADSAFSACESLKAIRVSPNNKAYSSDEGVLYDKNKTTLIQHPIAKDGDAYVIPDSVATIKECAFESNKYLKSIDIPDSVTDLGREAFAYCESLETVTVGKGVSALNHLAFGHCPNLKSVTLSDGLIQIGDFAFAGCTSLTEIKLPNSVSSIEIRAFYECENLKCLYILNKDCDIFDDTTVSNSDSYTIPKSATIYGYEGSTAQAYAEKFGIKFVPIEEPATEEQTTQEATTETTTQKPTTEADTQKPTTEKATEKTTDKATTQSTADKKDTAKSPDTGAAEKGLFAIAAIALAGGAVAFVKRKEQ